MRESKLTDMQLMFAHEYLIDLNACAAAIRAGYSEKTASRIGPELLGKPWVQEKIQELMDRRAKKTDITAERVLNELAVIGFADIGKFLSFKEEEKLVGYDNADQPVYAMEPVVNVVDSSTVDTRAISEVTYNAKQKQFKLKMHDKKAALTDIARHLGMFAADKLTVEQEGEVVVKVRFVDPTEQ